MSHTLAARCTVCGLIDDIPCPECGTMSSTTHGTTDQRPFTNAPDPHDGYVHEWHAACIPAEGADHGGRARGGVISASRDDHPCWAAVCTCGMSEQERTGHYPEHASWCDVPSPLDEEEATS